MPEPLRSPKQSRVTAKSRSHPYSRPANSHRTRDVGVERSNSLLGTIKSFVTAPLSWLSLGDSQESGDSHQKRRVSGTEREGTPPQAKRARRHSPEVGFLDPPSSLFELKRPPIPLWNVANGVPPARTMSIDSPSSSIEPAKLPLPPSRGPSILSRTSMSIEPQDTFPVRRSVTRDLSMPPQSPFARSYSRSSLTPQPVGATFGPSPKRKARESTAPPLLGSSTPTPAFTRPPPSTAGPPDIFPKASSKDRSDGPITALLARNTQSVSPARESPTRSMLISDEVSMSRSQSKNSAERVLSTLESFRTPLHTSRFPSAPAAEGLRPRKVHVPIPSKLILDHTPEGRKDKAKRAPAVIGPYSAGMSGMRKLLARRREEFERQTQVEIEAESEKVQTRSNAEQLVQETRKGAKAKDIEEKGYGDSRISPAKVNGVSPKVDTALSRSRSPTRSKVDTLYSTLRAPSSRVSRTHAPAPKLKKTRNKFSLDDEDEEWNMSVEELKNYQAQAPQTQPHISFSATRRMSEIGMQTDKGPDDTTPPRAASPPLPTQSQTFDSLLSRIGPPAATSPILAADFPPETQETKPDAKLEVSSRPSSEAGTAPATLPFSLGASSTPIQTPKFPDAILSPFASTTPTPALSPAPASPAPTSTDGSVPSFFANSNAQFTPPKVPSGSLFGGLLPNDEGTKEAGQPKNVSERSIVSSKEVTQDQTETQKESKPSPFGSISKPSIFNATSSSPFGSASLSGKVSNSTATNAPSSFGNLISGSVDETTEAPESAFSFGAPAANSTDVPKPGINIFGAASKPDSSTPTTNADSLAKPAFSFGAPTSTSTPPADQPETSSTAPTTNETSKPAFSFGATSSSSSTEPPKGIFAFSASASTQPKTTASEAPKSPFSFGAAPSTPPPADKKPAFTFGTTSGTPAFSFGSGTATDGAANASTASGPKPLFGGFGDANATTVPSTPKPEPTVADNGDNMEVAGDRMEESPTRTVDKKDSTPLTLPQSSPFAAFGGSSGTGFSFGQDKATPTSGGFSFGQSKPATTTGFSFGQSAVTSTTSTTSNTGFSFGADSSKTAGHPTSPFGSSTFGATVPQASSSSSFSFGQPSTSTAANPFSQPQQQPENRTSTAPSSPSLFPQPTSQPQSPSFSFSLPAASNAFGAPKPDVATPSSPSTQPFQFGASSASQQPQQQSGAAAPNNMFTLGGAATPPRKVKGLPTRRIKRP